MASSGSASSKASWIVSYQSDVVRFYSLGFKVVRVVSFGIQGE